ncbi:MAG: hypothetical protein HN411_00065 [Waddliaceae bacterium]|nr:hypothetical protein [Waddliaceae bacterium]MBT6929114.1 hypothetical protein [Waddliaceae bacterium]
MILTGNTISASSPDSSGLIAPFDDDTVNISAVSYDSDSGFLSDYESEGSLQALPQTTRGRTVSQRITESWIEIILLRTEARILECLVREYDQDLKIIDRAVELLQGHPNDPLLLSILFPEV